MLISRPFYFDEYTCVSRGQYGSVKTKNLILRRLG